MPFDPIGREGSQVPVGGSLQVWHGAIGVTDHGELTAGSFLIDQLQAHHVGGDAIGAEQECTLGGDAIMPGGWTAFEDDAQGIDQMKTKLIADVRKGNDVADEG